MNSTHQAGLPNAGESVAYERPQVTVLGTLAELTQGIVPITNDGIGPGSLN